MTTPAPKTYLQVSLDVEKRIRADPDLGSKYETFLNFTDLRRRRVEAGAWVLFPCHPDEIAYAASELVGEFEYDLGKTLFVTVEPIPPRKRTRFGILTVGDLKEALETVPDATPVLVSGGPDHSYHTPHHALLQLAEYEGAAFCEWHGPEHASEGTRPVAALVLNV